jgi:hypothetical protein
MTNVNGIATVGDAMNGLGIPRDVVADVLRPLAAPAESRGTGEY